MFTAIAAGVGLAATAASAGMSFTQAAKQRKLQSKAESDAARYMAEARKKLEVNFYEQLGIQKEPYELEREALISAGAQAIEAGVESERGAAAVAGRVQAAQQLGQRQIASAMGQEMAQLEKLTAAEEGRLRDIGINIDMAEAEGAQTAAKQAATLGAQATQQGLQGVTSLVGQVASLAPLYEKTASAKQFSNLEKDYSKAISEGSLGYQFRDASGNPLPFQEAMAKMGGFGVDMSGVSKMNPVAFQDYITKQSAENLKNIRSSGFAGNVIPTNYNPFQISPFEENMFMQSPEGFNLNNNLVKPTLNKYN